MFFTLASLALAQGGQEDEAPAVELRYRETIPYPDGLDGGRPYWKTDRFGRILVADSDEDLFVVDQGARLLRPFHTDDRTSPYRFSMRMLQRWSDSWWVVRDELRVPLDEGPDFTGAALVRRWGDDHREALLRLERDGIEIYTVVPPATVRDFPACSARVPASCVASALHTLAVHGGDPLGERVARAQFERACSEGLTRACFLAEAMGGPHAAEARACLDGDATACAAVGRARAEDADGEAGRAMLVEACEHGVAAACVDAAGLLPRSSPRALLLLGQACAHGDGDACSEEERRRRLVRATRLQEACTAEPPDAHGCAALAELLDDHPIESIPISAFEARIRACRAGAVEPCRTLAPEVDRLGLDEGPLHDLLDALLADCPTTTASCVGAAHLLARTAPGSASHTRAGELFRDACVGGDDDACLVAASSRWHGDSNLSPEELLRHACDRDHAEACARLGALLLPRRPEDAVAALQRGCSLGAPSACTDLALAALGGQAEADAMASLQRACDAGDGRGCYHLGEIHPDRAIAARAYAVGCDAGNARACAASANVLADHGDDPLPALTRACDGGIPEACRTLSRRYRDGEGVRADRRHARALRARARAFEPLHHLRIGARLGSLNLAGAEIEGLVPLYDSAALGVGTELTYLPGTHGLAITYLGATLRAYPSASARGFYGAIGLHRFHVSADGERTTNGGLDARAGFRFQRGSAYVGAELGLATLRAPRVAELIRPFPVLAPVFGLSAGAAVF